jgi:hypothetical protein
MVEIGVWQADNALQVLCAHTNVIFHGVDPWRKAPPDDSYTLSDSMDSRSEQHEFDSAYLRTMERLAPYGDRAVIHRAMSAEVARDFREADLVFIDGDHSYDGCLNDIRLWRRAVKSGGWIGGHDYLYERFPGVTTAVRKEFPNWREMVIIGTDCTWWYRMD